MSEKIYNDQITGENEDILFERIGMPLSNQGMEILIEGIRANSVCVAQKMNLV